MIDPVVRYQKDYQEIVELVWQTYLNSFDTQDSLSGRSLQHRQTPSHLATLRRLLVSIQKRYWSSFSLEKQDIKQQLAYLWYRYQKKWDKKKKKKTSFRDYLLQCSVWGLDTWYRQEVMGVSHSMTYSTDPMPHQEKSKALYLDLAFLAEDTVAPLDVLDPHERYLIYLKYKEEKNIVEISDIIQQDRGIVSDKMKQIFNKMRSLTDATTNSG